MADPQAIPRAAATTRLVGPLTARPASGDRLTLAELPVPGQINLRGRPSDTAFLAAAGSVLDCRLPVSPNTVQTSGDLTVLWLGPDEWLVLTPPGAEPAIIARLREALHGIHGAVTDVSGNLARLRLAGSAARDVLAKGCSLDLHPRGFQPGQCAQTLIARSGVILHQIDGRPSYDLLPRRSFAEYLWMWLTDAMSEFDGRTIAGS
jgi:sarcosine oxidase subunit gamma